MKKIITLMIFGILLLASGILAQDNPLMDEYNTKLDSMKTIESEVFAPDAYSRAANAFKEAQRAIELKKNSDTIDKLLQQSIEYAENALKATEVARLALAEYLEPRQKAIDAKARDLAAKEYLDGELQFVKATGKVESGDVKGGIKEAQKSVPLFDAAEMAAIKVDILGKADSLIEKATQGDAKKYALATFDKAVKARAKADSILSANRYERKESLAQASTAEYEARHSSNIAQMVRSLERNDQAWEKLILVYEIQMQQVADEFHIGILPFDEGPGKAADSLVNLIKGMRDVLDKDDGEIAEVTESLTSALTAMGVTTVTKDFPERALMVKDAVIKTVSDKKELQDELESCRAELKNLGQEHDEIAGELEERKEEEAKFQKAQEMISPSEGEVLYNATNDIVLRLGGLSFDVGSSDIKDEHIPLLEKIKAILEMFPNSKVMVEGHTDDTGDPTTNMRLSEKRAFAVMQYLRQAMQIPVDRIQSIGYGSERPVASNKTSDGRAKNRRIDIIIMQ